MIGLSMGSGYALFAQGAVLIHRGSGLINFAQGAIGSLAAYVTFVDLVDGRGWPIVVALPAGLVMAGSVSLAFDVIVLRRLRGAPALVRVIATVALFGLAHAVMTQRYGIGVEKVDRFLPDKVYDVRGVKLQSDRMITMAIAIVVTVGAWAGTKFTRVGLAMQAAAENPRAARTLAWSTDRLGALTWAVGGALGGLAAILVAPMAGLTPTTFTLAVTISGLGAALLGGFRSFPLTFVGGLGIGVGEALATRYGTEVADLVGEDRLAGIHRAPALIVIIAVLIARGRALPQRSHVTERLPRVGSGSVHVPLLVAGVVGAAGCVLLGFGEDGVRALSTSAAAGVMVLSVVVLTGYAGQLSLAQWSIGGIAALVGARLVTETGLPIELALLGGILATIPIGVMLALPALRTRGVNLAVLTLGLGYLITEVVFNNGAFLGSGYRGGTPVGAIELLGVRVDAQDHPRRWALVCVAAFAFLAVMVANLRRSPTGRRLLAIRSNERAAASLGISVVGVKLYAFGVAAGIAGTGAVLIAFEARSVRYVDFGAFQSIQGVGDAVLGGVGYVLAGVFAAANTADGLGAWLLGSLGGISAYNRVVAAALVLVFLVLAPDGLARIAVGAVRRARGPGHAEPHAEWGQGLDEPSAAPRVRPATLAIEGLTVRFGAVIAVDDVTLTIGPGEVVGLIGPNGAGKTTVIDAVTGFVSLASGRVELAGTRIDTIGVTGRSRLGLRRSFQSVELFDDLTVAENISAGADTGRWWTWITDLARPASPPVPATAVAAAREFGLSTHLGTYPSGLSAGQRRLAGIARTVASGPSVVLLDEPAAGLDETETSELSALIRWLADAQGMAVLLVEHDVGLVLTTCDRVVVLDFGRVIADGTPDEIRRHRAVVDAYLGSAH